MKKRIIYIFIISIILMILFLNIYLEMQYDINIFEHFSKSRELTEEERQWLTEHGNIIYGSDQNSPPLRYTDELNGQYQGLVVDYIRALSIELGKQILIKPIESWNEALKSLSNKETDCLDMIISEERKKEYVFSDPIYNLSGVILVSKEDNTIISYEDLEGKYVAVPNGDYAIDFLNSKLSNINFIYTNTIESAINKLKDGEVQAVVGDEPVITYIIQNMNLKDAFIILEEPMYQKDVALGVLKSEKVLLSTLNKGIYNLKKKSTMIKIKRKWFGIAAPFAKENISAKTTFLVLVFISIFSLILYFFYCWNSVLKKEVEKRTEELYASRNSLQTTFDGLTHLMIVVDREHNIINLNEAFCRFLALDKDNIIGKNCIEFKNILYGHGVEFIIENTFYTNKQYLQEFKYKDKVFSMNTFPLYDKMNNVMNVLIMVKDVTKIRISEQQILHQDKMAAVGQLAAGVAHEIRNPLGLIRNYSYILKKNVDIEDEKINKSISVIESSVERASGIIDNLLNFSRISSNKCEKVNISNFINCIIMLEKKMLERNNINIELICDEHLLCCINQESLKHIFVNLISNSIDAMPDGGLIKIECIKKKNILSLEFSDTGIGMNDNDLENIFNPFFTTKPIGKGTGLGLYITYNEINKYGGNIRVKSKLGKGTSFYIEFPLRGIDRDDTK